MYSAARKKSSRKRVHKAQTGVHCGKLGVSRSTSQSLNNKDLSHTLNKEFVGHGGYFVLGQLFGREFECAILCI
jgi:hypothetical protein